MHKMYIVALAAATVLACKPKPAPAPPDTAVAVQPPADTMDSVGTDSILLDRHEWATDTDGVLTPMPDSVLDSILKAPTRRGAAVSAAGVAYGLSNWSGSQWGQQPFNSTMQQTRPDNALRLVRAAAKTGMRIFLVPARELITECGDNHCPLSLNRAKATTAAIARALPADTLRKYQGAVLGYNLADDYASAAQWGGQVVTQAQIKDWAIYTRQIWPDGPPIGVRVEPFWPAKDPELPKKLDYAWAQYRTMKGEVNTYFTKQVADAKRYGLSLVMGVNVHECGKQDSPPCTAAQLRQFYGRAISDPYGCASPGWKWDAQDWQHNDIRAAHFDLAAQARARTNVPSCRAPGAR